MQRSCFPLRKEDLRYSKVTIKAVFPNKEEAESYMGFESCAYFGLVTGLAGKNIEVSVSDSQLDYASVQKFIKLQADQVYLKKLEVTGKGNADAEPATIDICKKKLRHETEIEVVNIIQPGAAWTALFEAYRIFESKFEADCEFAEA